MGWRTVCAVELAPFPRDILIARQNDETFPPFPVWDDVATFDGRPWRGRVDVVSGGFPCTGFSAAGRRRGLEDAGSSLWFQMLRIVRDVRPSYVFLENTPGIIRGDGLRTVLGGLAALGFHAAWGVIRADCAAVGAPHRRARLFLVAHSRRRRRQGEGLRAGGPTSCRRDAAPEMGHAHSYRKPEYAGFEGEDEGGASWASWWRDRPPFLGVVDGVANRGHRLRALGNGQVPGVAARAFIELAGRIAPAGRGGSDGHT